MIRSNSRFVDLPWRKARASSTGSCVLVTPYQGGAAVSDSKSADAAVLVFSADEWTEFIGRARAGAFGTVPSS